MPSRDDNDSRWYYISLAILEDIFVFYHFFSVAKQIKYSKWGGIEWKWFAGAKIGAGLMGVCVLFINWPAVRYREKSNHAPLKYIIPPNRTLLQYQISA